MIDQLCLSGSLPYIPLPLSFISSLYGIFMTGQFSSLEISVIVYIMKGWTSVKYSINFFSALKFYVSFVIHKLLYNSVRLLISIHIFYYIDILKTAVLPDLFSAVGLMDLRMCNLWKESYGKISFELIVK